MILDVAETEAKIVHHVLAVKFQLRLDILYGREIFTQQVQTFFYRGLVLSECLLGDPQGAEQLQLDAAFLVECFQNVSFEWLETALSPRLVRGRFVCRCFGLKRQFRRNGKDLR